jgi:hypothetical protein
MFPTRHDAMYGVGILLTFLTVGWTTPYVVFVQDHDPLAMGSYLLMCVISVALIAGYFRHLRNNSPAVLHRHALEARRQVVRLLDADYDMLAPSDDDCDTARLLIRMNGDDAVIEKETWRGTRHYYIISPSGELTREIFGDVLTRADHRWLRPLTAARLAYLVQALRSTYSPRQRVKTAS